MVVTMTRMSAYIFVCGLMAILVGTTGCRVYTERDHAKQSQTSLPDLDSISHLADSVEVYAEQFPHSPAYILNLNHRVENTMYFFGRSIHAYSLTTLDKTYVVFDPDDEEFSTFTLELESGPENLEGFHAQVVDPDGNVKTYTRDNLQWVGRDNATAKLAFDNIVEGCIVQIAYNSFDITPEGLIAGFVPLQYSVPVRDLSVSVCLPMEFMVNFKEMRSGEKPEFVTSTTMVGLSELQEYRFKRHNVSAIHKEPYSPYLLNLAEHASYQVAGMRSRAFYGAGGFAPDVSDALQAVARREGDRLGARFIRRFTDEIVEQAGAETKEEKVEVVVNWVLENTEVNPSIDRPTYRELVEDGQGDKWTITDLLRAMLDHLRVETEYVFIHDGRFGHFDRKFMDGSMRTPALRFEYKGEDIVCMPYLPQLPIGMLPPQFMYEPAYCAEGYNPRGRFDTITEGAARVSVMSEEFNIVISEEGVVSVEEITTYSGTGALAVKEGYDDAKESKEEDALEEFFDSFVTYDEGNIEVENPRFELTEDGRNYSVTVSVEYSIDNLVTVLPDEVVFQTGGLLAPNTDYSEELKPDERNNPIHIRVDESNAKTVNISYPKSWKLYSKLDGTRTQNDLGSAHIVFETGNGNVTIKQEQLLKRGQWTKERARELYALIEADAGAKVPTLVFTK